MARNRKKTGSLTFQCEERLKSMLRIGEPRRQAKIDGTSVNFIYSWETFKTYLKSAIRFAKWCKEQHNCKTLDECRPFVKEYMEACAKLSASTAHTYGSALAKLYGSTHTFDDVRIMNKYKIKTDFSSVKKRARADIKRSRGAAARDAGFNTALPQNAEYVDFCRSVGLRVSEVKALRGAALGTAADGKPCLKGIKGKGGRVRDIPIIGNVDLVVRKMTEAGGEKVFPRVPSHADTHSYRADYANRLYQMYARPVKDIPRKDRYYCKKDKRGVIYDKVAMDIVSKALGHSRRDVIAGNYLW